MRSGSDLSIGWSRSMPVSTEPGQIVMTRMFSLRTSSISERLNPSTRVLGRGVGGATDESVPAGQARDVDDGAPAAARACRGSTARVIR